MSIFVQMTAYRGLDVIPTVRNCIERAKDKEGLHFGICLQQDEDTPPELAHDRIKVERVAVKDSLGHGWARSRAQALYAGQDYTLQIESGCRFADGWDEGLVDALKMTGSEKPIITNPANKLKPENGELEHPTVSYKAQCYQFLLDTPAFWPVPLKNIVALQRARNISDHFFFAPGGHCTEVLYDPTLYYSEVESALSLRSFTHGYDLFHHFKPFVFRNYAPRPMHWNDDAEWWAKDRSSKERFSSLVSGSLQEFGLGESRSLRDWELYSGIDYKGRRLQKDTVQGVEPPCKFENEAKWESEYMKDHAIVASWDTSRIDDSTDYDYWFFAVEDSAGAVITRQDLRWERDKAILEKRANSKKIFFKSIGDKKPARIAIQPFSKSKGGLTKVNFELA
jgi:hypothetical protein